MEIEKAIEILSGMHTENAEEAEAVSVGVDALKKQIPAPPTAKLYGRDGDYEIFCPCGEKVSYLKRRCSSCGQALDWSDITAEVIGPYGV